VKRRAYSLMVLYKELRKMVLKLLNSQMDKKIFYSLMVQELENFQMEKSEKLFQTALLKTHTDNNE